MAQLLKGVLLSTIETPEPDPAPEPEPEGDEDE